jgi:hypothetical protein
MHIESSFCLPIPDVRVVSRLTGIIPSKSTAGDTWLSNRCKVYLIVLTGALQQGAADRVRDGEASTCPAVGGAAPYNNG